MTDDLNALVREHVTTTEPPFLLDVAVPIRQGRRRLRGRRIAGALAAAAAVAAVAGVTAPRLLDSSAPVERAIDPATRRALADYDAQRMPDLLDEHARAVLERRVPDLPEGVFRARDEQGNAVPPRHYDKASGMSMSYGADTDHQFAVDLGHSRGEAEGDARKFCADGLQEGYYLTCEVATDADGNVAVTLLQALRPFWGEDWMAVTRDELDGVDPERVWFQREAKVIHSETFLTYVSETVHAPDQASAERTFQVPFTDLVELGTDPELVIPPPPPGINGCGWIIPSQRDNISCEG
jgi:hypothetical protein